MYQTGMHMKEVLECFSGGPWNAALHYDCETAVYTAALQYLEGPEICFEKVSTFTVNSGTEEEGERASLRTAVQLWQVLSGLACELLAEHAEALIQEGYEKHHNAALEKTIRDTILEIESAGPAPL